MFLPFRNQSIDLQSKTVHSLHTIFVLCLGWRPSCKVSWIADIVYILVASLFQVTFQDIFEPLQIEEIKRTSLSLLTDYQISITGDNQVNVKPMEIETFKLKLKYSEFYWAEMYSEPYHKSKMELFMKMLDDFNPFMHVVKWSNIL